MATPSTHPGHTLTTATTEFEKLDRCKGLDHRPRVLLGKMGLDGHDRGVKVIARALRDSGVHVIYSGLWQTPRSLAISAVQEDCDVIAASMMSNSHLVLGPRLVGDLKALGRPDVPVYMGGILPSEDVSELLKLGVSRCFTTATGLMDIVEAVKGAVKALAPSVGAADGSQAQLARDISLVHAGKGGRSGTKKARPQRVIGVTGSPGAGKSTLVAQLAGEYTRRAKENPVMGRAAVVAFDPMSPITGGALLGDRLRVDFNAIDDAIFYRSLAITSEDYRTLDEILQVIGGATGADGKPIYRTVFVETVGAGQNETAVRNHVDKTAVVLTPGMGDAVQMDKAGILEIADVFVCNKADYPGQNELVKNLRDVAGRRPVLETVATMGKGVPELLDLLLS
ncbi:MAG TPA: cobalamin-dependent protein [Phycisphaerales bacterium]|nr:cobalamin-dependent protein [Phycisphaerales bacterium]